MEKLGICINVFFCLPSYCLYACLPANRYETKLWDLKYSLKTPHKDEGVLYNELKDFRDRYEVCMTTSFESVVDYFLQNNEARVNKKISNKNAYYTPQSAVDWELIRVQPIRYLWNETDQPTFYGVLVSMGLGTILKKGVSESSHDGDPNKLAAIAHVQNRFHSLDTMKLANRGMLSL